MSAGRGVATRIRGKAAKGVGRSAAFTALDWVQAALATVLGFRSHPGTLNLVLAGEEDRAAWALVRAGRGHLLPAGEPGFCDGMLYPCRMRRADGEAWQRAAAVWPQVPGYPVHDRIELLSPVNLREALGLEEGDEAEVEFEG